MALSYSWNLAATKELKFRLPVYAPWITAPELLESLEQSLIVEMPLHPMVVQGTRRQSRLWMLLNWLAEIKKRMQVPYEWRTTGFKRTLLTTFESGDVRSAALIKIKFSKSCVFLTHMSAAPGDEPRGCVWSDGKGFKLYFIHDF